MLVIMMFKSILLLVVIAFCWASPPQDVERKSGGICHSPADCSSDECCVLTNQRFTYPTCQSLRKVGELCRPTAHVRSSYLRFPDGSTFAYSGAHISVCPCAAGLKCSRTKSDAWATCNESSNLIDQ